jgi:hypothetical protein
VIWVVKLRSDPNLLAWYARVFDALTDFFLVAVSESGIDVPVAFLQSYLNSLANLAGRGLPCT